MAADTPDNRALLRQALLSLDKMQARLNAAERARTEPIAIIGIGCRFPGGASSPERFWELVKTGGDAITEVPPDRWDIDAYYDPDPDVPGRMCTRYGGFIGDVDTFDAALFGISPREALCMDPQQRLLLEVTWEALEHAGLAPDRLAGSQTGVFVGISTHDYSSLAANMGGAGAIDAYFGTGNASSVAAGRISYALGLQGPCMSIDTACSSSLVALHLACQSLRSKECEVALVGGVNLMLAPEVTINFSRAHMMAPGGRCKTFDAAADGYVRGEGCGVVVLKRLSDAVATRDTIIAQVLGSAVNQDGRSNGLTAPNGPAQEAVIRRALEVSGVAPAQIAYVETHGTGTSLGDPIEVHALGSVLKEGRSPENPVVLGAVKTNIGHLEAAAGIAGLIKTALLLQHQEIPPNLHLHQLNPHIAWSALPVTPALQSQPFPAIQGRRLAGVSSFGFGGTNAHAILEMPPPARPAGRSSQRSRHLLALSAHRRPALVELAGRYARTLTERPDTDPAVFAYSAHTGRARLPHRLALVGEDCADWSAALQTFVEGTDDGRARAGMAGEEPGEIAFLFTGQGAQYPGMGRHLYEREPVFRKAIVQCADLLKGALELPLAELICDADLRPELLDDTTNTQPALFALEYALAQLWGSWGVHPTALMGHSVGEYVAACVAGVFSLQDALTLISARAQLMKTLTRPGGMCAVFADEPTIRALLAGHEGSLSIAAINGPQEIVISGDNDHLKSVVRRLELSGIRYRTLAVSHAFHSPLMRTMLAAFLSVAQGIRYAPPVLRLISNVTGKIMDARRVCQPEYWVEHVMSPVLFEDGIQTLHALGYRQFIEIGPRTVLLAMGQKCVPEEGLWLPSLRKDQDPHATLLASLGALFVQGCPVDLSALEGREPLTRIEVPTYPFQGQRYWLETTGATNPSPAGSTHPASSFPDLAGSTEPAPVAETWPSEERAGAARAPLRRALTGAKPADRAGIVRSRVQAIVARVLGFSSSRPLDPLQGFATLGLDSLMAMELRRRLETELGQPLSPTLAFDFPNLDALTRHIMADVFSLESTGEPVSRSAFPVGTPIALVGIGCRLPGGVQNPTHFWRLLEDGVCAIGEVPADRWDQNAVYSDDPDAPGRTYSRHGGFIADVDCFDAEFFGISPREAQSMDPQQRVLLEVVWEALEDAGIPPSSLMGSRTGVFVGINTNDYGALVRDSGVGLTDGYAATGNTFSVAAGRISYALGLKGPSLAMDTACSSSLTATHLAVQSLRRGEIDLAIVGGINLMLTPDASIVMSKLRALSPTGRCWTFDAAADGYVRGEGCGVVVLRRLADAEAGQDRIYALIRGTAVNQDGRTSGLTVPNGPAQQALIREALDDAGLQPSQVDCIEAHGTGTPLGDPIEVHALGQVLGRGRPPEQPLALTSVKTNFGHLEAAAGIAGLIKAALAIYFRKVPAHLGFSTPNPHISWEELPVRVPTSTIDWPGPGPMRTMGVSAFGFSGTNAHVVLTGGERSVRDGELEPPDREKEGLILVLSAKSEASLRTLALQYRALLKGRSPEETRKICAASSHRRTHHALRLALVGRSAEALEERLDSYLAESTGPGIASGHAPVDGPGRIAFVFPGQGGQWRGMGRQLLRQESTFRESILRCDEIIQSLVGWSVVDAIGDETSDRLECIDVLQPTLFAIMVSLADLWRSWGIMPSAVLGHSMGEAAAAYAAGALSLEDAARVICLRSRLMRRLSGRGAMALVGLPREQVEESLLRWRGLLEIAACNGPRATVVAGEPAAIDGLLDTLAVSNVFHRRVNVDVASHCSVVEPICDELNELLSAIVPLVPGLPLYSTVEGRILAGAEMDAGYWVRNLRKPVLFSTMVEHLARDGIGVLLEVSPHPILAQPMESCVQAMGSSAQILFSLQRDTPERESLLETLGALYCAGHAIAWQQLQPDEGPAFLPTYPWQKHRFWLQPSVDVDATRPHSRRPPLDELQDWFYRIEWVPTEAPAGRLEIDAPPPGHWGILLDRGGVGEALAQRLEALGQTCTRIPCRVVEEAPGAPTVDECALETVDILGKCSPDSIPFRGVVHLWGLDAPAEGVTSPSLDQTMALGGEGLVSVVKRMASRAQPVPGARLWVVTRGAQPVLDEDRVAVEQATLWGVGRVAALEHPELWGALIDLDPGESQAQVDALVEVLLEPSTEDQIALRRGRRRVARLVRSRPERRGAMPALAADGLYLVTGGLGHLGLKLAHWLVDRGARHLLLTGRRGLPPRDEWDGVDRDSEQGRQIAALRMLEERGATLSVQGMDVGDAQQVAELFARVRAEGPALRGVLHAAGIHQPQAIVDMDLASFRAHMRAKVHGSWHLHQETAGLDLDFFVCFASAASIWGSAGTAHYAAANHFQDALAHYRHRHGLVATTVDWGWWADGGMVSSEARAYFKEIGLNVMPTSSALSALEQLLQAKTVQATVASVDWRLFKPVYEARRRRHLLDAIEDRPEAGAVDGVAPPSLIEKMKQISLSKRWDALIRHLQLEVGGILGFGTDRLLDPRKGFFQSGMDSIMSVQLKRRLEAQLGRSLPSTLAFEHPTVEALAAFVGTTILALPPRDSVPVALALPAEAEEEAPALDGLSEDELLTMLELELNQPPRRGQQ